MDELQLDDDQLGRIRVEAYQLLLTQAKEAAGDGDLSRFDEVMARLVPAPAPDVSSSGPIGVEESHRQRWMDWWRIGMAALLVGGLIAIVAYAIGRESQEAAQYVPLVSGLAGIAIGWLYSGITSQHFTGDGA